MPHATYEIDPVHSSAQFSVRHMTAGRRGGRHETVQLGTEIWVQ